MVHHKGIKLFFIIATFYLFVLVCAGCSPNSQSATASSVPPGGGVIIRAQVVKLTQGEYATIGKNGIVNPSIDDFRTLFIGVNVVGINPEKEKKITCPDIGEITAKLSTKVVRYTNSSSMNNDTDSVVNFDNTLVLYTKGISNDALKSKLKGLKIEASYTDTNGKTVLKSYDIADVLQFI